MLSNVSMVTSCCRLIKALCEHIMPGKKVFSFCVAFQSFLSFSLFSLSLSLSLSHSLSYSLATIELKYVERMNAQ